MLAPYGMADHPYSGNTLFLSMLLSPQDSNSETELKMIGLPCLEDLGLCIEFFRHAIEGVVTGVVS